MARSKKVEPAFAERTLITWAWVLRLDADVWLSQDPKCPTTKSRWHRYVFATVQAAKNAAAHWRENGHPKSKVIRVSAWRKNKRTPTA